MVRNPKFDAFISYARSDVDLVEKLGNFLNAVGLNVWFDQWELVPGQRWDELVSEAIEDAAAIVVCIGCLDPSSSHETDKAIRLVESVQPHHAPIVIPVILPGGDTFLPPALSKHALIDLRDDVHNPGGLARLISSVRAAKRGEDGRIEEGRNLALSYREVGKIQLNLGQSGKAREAYLRSLAIAERLVRAEPDRADYQRDLAASYERMAELYGALGQGEEARQAYVNLLAIAERLAQSEPDRIDYQRDLSVSYNKIGDLYSALGQGDEARRVYVKSLAIAERLAQTEPNHAGYQRDLSVSYNKMGDLYSALGQGDEARQAYVRSLAIAERLVQ